MIMVNGNTWPFQTVEQRRYRFRFLNGCQSRFLILDFNQIPGVEVWQIGNEGGFLAAPVNLTADERQPAADGPGRARRPDRRLHQRAGGQLRAGQRRPGRAVRRRRSRRRRTSTSPTRTPPDRSCSSGSSRPVAPDPTTPPQFLLLPALTPLPAETVTRPLALIEESAIGFDADGNEVDGPAEALLGIVEHGCRDRADVDGPGHREPERRRHRGLGVLQHHRRRPPDARPRGDLRGRRPAGPGTRRGRRGRPADPARPATHAARALGDRLQGHRHRLSRTGHAGPLHVHQPRASSSGTATSSSTRTTR